MRHLPVILEVESKLLGVFDDEGGIANRDAHRIDGAGSFKSIWKCAGAATCCRGIGRDSQDATGICSKVNLQGWIEFEKSAHEWGPDVIKPGLEGVPANVLGQVVFELELALD